MVVRQLNGKTLVFDWDGVIGANNNGNYKDAPSFLHAIEQINIVYDMGTEIVISTARYMDREKGNVAKIYQRAYYDCVEWLKKYGVKYDLLILGMKYPANMYIDDKGCTVDSSKGMDDWNNNFWPMYKKLENLDKYNQPINRPSELADHNDLLVEFS
jgi:capsule biosynthesis phosphatase